MSTFREQLKGRFAVLGIVAMLVLASLAARLWTMQVLSASEYVAAAQSNSTRQVSLPAARGRILDAKGRPLVTNRAVMAVTAQSSIAASATLVARLSAAIDVSVADIQKKLASYKQERLAPRTLRTDIPLATASFLVEHAADFPGVSVEEAAVRQYPYGSLAAHVLGYTGEISEAQLASSTRPDAALGDIVGKTGIEAYYDSVLQGDKGFRRYEVDNQGRIRSILAEGAPRAGKDIRLTIDMDVQAVAERALSDALAEANRQGFPAHAGAAVVLDLHTGAVIAMASAPTYDPTAFLGGVSAAVWKHMNDPSSDYPLNNRAIMAGYAPASTFKPIVAMAALGAHLIGPNTVIYCPARWTGLGVQWAKWNWDHHTNQSLSLSQAIVKSNDSYFYEVGKRFYNTPGEKLQSFARSIGLGARLGIDLPGEVSGRIPDAAWKKAFNANYPEYQQWVPGDTVNMSIGQGDVLLTPLQLATAYAALGNGGTVVRPHILQAVLGTDGSPSVVATVTTVSTPNMSQSNLAVIRQALLGVTTSGTSKSAFYRFPKIVAAKTGTAQVTGKKDTAVFACYAPVQAPKYAIAVIIEQGGHGGTVAAPAARQILSKLFSVKFMRVTSTDTSR
ncbi:MAG TPA: penicillin-binding protein 2 [Coriobacteriia bacterium]